jgi:hypothetical protein
LNDHLEFIKRSITESTLIAIVSGAENPNLIKIKKFSSAVFYLKKPFDNNHFREMIKVGLIISKFGLPEIEAIKKDYDFQENKYKPAIKLLLQEWTSYTKHLINCIRKGNLEEFDEILHKFNTTLRRLKLSKFEEKLVSIKDDIALNKVDSKVQISDLKSIMRSYYTFIENLLAKNN